MTIEELSGALASLGMPVAYGEFLDTEENPAPDPPFITYQFAENDDIKADNHNYLAVSNIDIELYTDRKDPAKETLVENKLNELRLPYRKSEVWIEAERMRQVLYQIQLIGG